MMKRILIAGPSGTGKTTLAKYIEQKYQITRITSKETRQVTTPQALEWEDRYDYRYSDNIGHQALINLQSQYPEFGVSWQRAMLEARFRRFRDTKGDFVCDRSFIDNIVFMLTQVAHNATEQYIKSFLRTVFQGNRECGITHLIWVRQAREQPQVEDNGSRVPNMFYQLMIDSVFQLVINELVPRYSNEVGGKTPGMETMYSPTILEIKLWDWEDRIRLVDNFLQE